MNLIHTSPAEITTVTNKGRFGEFLFFSSKEYVMTEAASTAVYSIEIADGEIIEAAQLFYHAECEKLEKLVAKVARKFGVAPELAESLLDESKDIHDVESSVDAEDMGEASWEIQKFTAQAAKILGYRGVAVTDEQGTSYMIDMLHPESRLELMQAA